MLLFQCANDSWIGFSSVLSIDISKGTQRPSNLTQVLRQRGMIERDLLLIDHELERFHRVNILQEKQTNK